MYRKYNHNPPIIKHLQPHPPRPHREIGGVESTKTRHFCQSLDPSGVANRVLWGSDLSPQLSPQLSLHPDFGYFSKGVRRPLEGCSTGPFLGAFRGLCRASQLPVLFAPVVAREKAENGPKTSWQPASGHRLDRRRNRAPSALTIIFAASRKRSGPLRRPVLETSPPGHKKSGQNQPPDFIFQPSNRPV